MDWSSKFTWLNVREISSKLSHGGFANASTLQRFAETIVTEWHWLRLSMENRYVMHSSNAKMASPLALNEQFNVLVQAIQSKWKDTDCPASESGGTQSCFDDEF